MKVLKRFVLASVIASMLTTSAYAKQLYVLNYNASTGIMSVNVGDYKLKPNQESGQLALIKGKVTASRYVYNNSLAVDVQTKDNVVYRCVFTGDEAQYVKYINQGCHLEVRGYAHAVADGSFYTLEDASVYKVQVSKNTYLFADANNKEQTFDISNASDKGLSTYVGNNYKVNFVGTIQDVEPMGNCLYVARVKTLGSGKVFEVTFGSTTFSKPIKGQKISVTGTLVKQGTYYKIAVSKIVGLK